MCISGRYASQFDLLEYCIRYLEERLGTCNLTAHILDLRHKSIKTK